MIHTIALNPAMEYSMQFSEDPHTGETTRAQAAKFDIGGKGLRCAAVFNNMGIPSVLHTYLGGPIGDRIQDQLKEYPLIQNDSLTVAEETPLHVLLETGKVTCLKAPAPALSEDTLSTFLEGLKGLSSQDYVLLCGKAPEGIPATFLYDIADLVNDAGARLILDTKDLRLEDLNYCRPWLIKPNRKELSDLLQEPSSKDNALEQLQKVLSKGAENVLLTLGPEGAVFAGSLGCAVAKAPIVQEVHPGGAGDAALAAFTGTYVSTGRLEDALRWSMSAGSAAVASENIPTRMDIEAYLNGVRIEQARA